MSLRLHWKLTTDNPLFNLVLEHLNELLYFSTAKNDMTKENKPPAVAIIEKNFSPT